ncbi:MAG TPA: methyltransferase domain-containing protein [Pyrinomonadaceae bacterium]
MDASDELKEVVAAGRTVRLIEEDIYSVLPDVSVQHLYDKRASLYDFFVSTRLYNYLMWGASPGHYSQFAREALNSSQGGIFLDAGCGSLLFTARDYAASKRQIVAFDQSLAMLRRARRRLRDLSGRVPEHIRLLQADLRDLPFRRQSFHTVLCLNVIHQIDDAAALVAGLKELLSQDGSLHLTSLISNDRAIGDWYLRALYRTGEFVRPRNERELRELFVVSFGKRMSYVEQGNMAFITGFAGG